MTDKIRRSLDFVVRYYRPGAFKPDLWAFAPQKSFWRRYAVAASVAGGILLAAAAVTAYVALNREETPQTPLLDKPEPIKKTPEVTLPITPEIKKIEFNDASLPEVVKAIESVYGVKVNGNTSGQPNLTLSYQGTAEDLISTINDLLGTNLSIEK